MFKHHGWLVIFITVHLPKKIRWFVDSPIVLAWLIATNQMQLLFGKLTWLPFFAFLSFLKMVMFEFKGIPREKPS